VFLVVFATLLASLLAGELSLRALLFSDHETLARWGEPLRNPYRFSSYNTPENWKLRVLFQRDRRAKRNAQRKHPNYDPVLGQRRKVIGLDYAHEAEARIAGRRPILLFGDSFGQCVAAIESCWGDLLEETEWGRDHVLINYSVGGYGLDQITLLLENALPRFLDQNSIVILSLLVDDDIDRCYLPMRTFAKPYYTLDEDGEATFHPAPDVSPVDYIRANPPEIRSYLWRYVLFSLPGFSRDTRLAWTGHGDQREVKERLAEHLFDRCATLFEETGVDFFFLLFYGPQGAREEVVDWRDELVRTYLAKPGLPYVPSDRYLLEAVEREGAALPDYFFPDGAAKGHYNDRGNRVVFQGILDGLDALRWG
jgi:hypothetical protein